MIGEHEAIRPLIKKLNDIEAEMNRSYSKIVPLAYKQEEITDFAQWRQQAEDILGVVDYHNLVTLLRKAQCEIAPYVDELLKKVGDESTGIGHLHVSSEEPTASKAISKKRPGRLFAFLQRLRRRSENSRPR
ncbi:MAG: hypothetical protein ACP5N6_08215 [Anaerolineae bacterium]